MNSRYVRQHQKPALYIIMPTNKFKVGWNVVIIMLLAYTSTVVPFQVAFVDIDGFFTVILNYIIDILFGIDIIINFFSAYEHPNSQQPETKLSKIASKYIWSWFLLDLIATIPTQLFTFLLEGGGASGSTKLVRLARLPRLYRLIRLMRIFKILKMFKYNKKFNEWFGALKL